MKHNNAYVKWHHVSGRMNIVEIMLSLHATLKKLTIEYNVKDFNIYAKEVGITRHDRSLEYCEAESQPITRRLNAFC